MKHAADTFNRAIGAGALCIANAALYEFGAKGEEEKMNDALEGIELFIDVSDSANLIEEGSPLVAIKDPVIGVAMFIIGRIVKSGGRIHNRNEKHRAMVRGLGCLYLSRNNTNSRDEQFNASVGCFIDYVGQLEE